MYTMEQKTIVLNSELEFRESLTQNTCEITQIIVVKSLLDQTIYFYYYTKDGTTYTTKETSLKKFSFYKKIYKRIAENLNLHVFPNTAQLITAKIS